MNRSFVLLFFIAFSSHCFSQQATQQPFTVGDKIPSSLWHKLGGSRPPQLTILDFWSTGCLSCMEAFPKMEKLQQQFAGKLEVILVNPWETELIVKDRIEKLNVQRKKNGAEEFFLLPATLRRITGDTIYKHLFPTKTVPLHVWVNSEGNILYITSGYNAAPAIVEAVLKGEKVRMSLKDDSRIESVMKDGMIRSTLPGVPVYYSAFMPYIAGDAWPPQRDDSAQNIFRVVYYNIPVLDLFTTAFISRSGRDFMILEVKDKERFRKPDYKTEGHLLDAWNNKYCFSYEMLLPQHEKDSWQYKMQYDLNFFFGNRFGIRGAIEKRTFKSLVLVQTKKGLLKTTGGEPEQTHEKNSVTWINQPFTYVVQSLYPLQDMKAGRPFINETGLGTELKVDMKLTGNFANVNNIRKQLQQYGLDIIEAEREIEVLVLRDLEVVR